MVAAPGGRIDRELVLEDEAATSYDVVENDYALEGDGGGPGVVEAVHKG